MTLHIAIIYWCHSTICVRPIDDSIPGKHTDAPCSWHHTVPYTCVLLVPLYLVIICLRLIKWQHTWQPFTCILSMALYRLIPPIAGTIPDQTLRSIDNNTLQSPVCVLSTAPIPDNHDQTYLTTMRFGSIDGAVPHKHGSAISPWHHTSQQYFCVQMMTLYLTTKRMCQMTLPGQPLEFGNGLEISFHTLLGIWLLIHAEIKVNPC